MSARANSALGLVEAVAGAAVRARIERSLTVGDTVVPGGPVPRLQVAHALAALLFDDLLTRVAPARAYVDDCVAAGRRVLLDHGALRTVDEHTASLPPGRAAFARILEPLGYRHAGVYDLARLRMTGHAFAHADAPESTPQYFVSELHVRRFSPDFQAATAAVLATTRDPLSDAAAARLERLRRDRVLPVADAVRLLPALVRCFGRHHDNPTLADYETLRAESAEMAWIATEGNVFNHATDRVADVRQVADRQRALGRAVKDQVERSATGRVLQTALRAEPVARRFRTPDGSVVRPVPGSFFEFIQRQHGPDGRLDLSFDSGNATGIFRMTAATDHG